MKVVAVEERTQGITLLRGLVGRPGMNETRSGDCDEGGARFMAERMKPDTSRLLLKHAVDPGTPAARSAGVPGSCRFASQVFRRCLLGCRRTSPPARWDSWSTAEPVLSVPVGGYAEYVTAWSVCAAGVVWLGRAATWGRLSNGVVWHTGVMM